MLRWIMKAFYPIKYQPPQRDEVYEYEIGEIVAVYDGWEVPVFYGLIEDRRKTKWTLRHPSGNVSSYDETYYTVEGKEYSRRSLKKVERHH